MLTEAAYPKCLGTPRRRRIETGETSAPADSMASRSLVVRSARTLQTPPVEWRSRAAALRLVQHHALRLERIQPEPSGLRGGLGSGW
jgi:hypothetical protein